MKALAWPLVFLALAGCGDDGSPYGYVDDVDLRDDAFSKTKLTVQNGTELEFNNRGDNDHTLTVHVAGAPEGTWDHDELLESGNTTEYLFEGPALVHVFCRFHGAPGSGMHLNVTVEA